jgi:hypothetical protein
VTDPEAINFNLRYYQKESLINNWMWICVNKLF